MSVESYDQETDMRLPDESGYTFKVVLIESRVTGVLAGLPDNSNETR